jgi:hypothetical protein
MSLCCPAGSIPFVRWKIWRVGVKIGKTWQSCGGRNKNSFEEEAMDFLFGRELIYLWTIYL